MNLSLHAYRNLPPADKIKAITVLVFMGILLTVLGFLIGMLLRQGAFEFSLPVQATPSSLIPVTAPTAFEQAAECRFSTMVLGTETFQIQSLTPQANASLAVPGDTTGIAYRIKGTAANTVFILSPTPQNISTMASISIGSPVTMMGQDCTSVTYSLMAPQAGPLDGSVLAAQSDEDIAVFFPTDSSGEGFTFKGRRVTEPVVALKQPTATVENTFSLAPTAANTASPVAEITTVPSMIPTEQRIASPTAEEVVPTATVAIPTPDYSEILAEIGLVDTSLSLFRTSLKIEVSIYNFGKIPIHLSEIDVSLTQPDGTVLALKGSKPSLPMDIQPGETKTIEFNFETPPSSTATLRVLTVEYDVEGY